MPERNPATGLLAGRSDEDLVQLALAACAAQAAAQVANAEAAAAQLPRAQPMLRYALDLAKYDLDCDVVRATASAPPSSTHHPTTTAPRP